MTRWPSSGLGWGPQGVDVIWGVDSEVQWNPCKEVEAAGAWGLLGRPGESEQDRRRLRGPRALSEGNPALPTRGEHHPPPRPLCLLPGADSWGKSPVTLSPTVPGTEACWELPENPRGAAALAGGWVVGGRAWEGGECDW